MNILLIKNGYPLKTWGKRLRINLRYIAATLVLISLATPFTNFWLIPLAVRKFKGVVYINGINWRRFKWIGRLKDWMNTAGYTTPVSC